VQGLPVLLQDLGQRGTPSLLVVADLLLGRSPLDAAGPARRLDRPPVHPLAVHLLLHLERGLDGLAKIVADLFEHGPSLLSYEVQRGGLPVPSSSRSARRMIRSDLAQTGRNARSNPSLIPTSCLGREALSRK